MATLSVASQMIQKPKRSSLPLSHCYRLLFRLRATTTLLRPHHFVFLLSLNLLSSTVAPATLRPSTFATNCIVISGFLGHFFLFVFSWLRIAFLLSTSLSHLSVSSSL
ncbi:hypothetical protein CC2G_003649 [Coprinopsis cinerea AmutBmut pab1-1]|nr:hypothetical protein CC2G_003649 [Coprinopsis cinerea AmutBmut pab1-1]